MSKLIYRLKKRYNMTMAAFQNDKKFSTKYAWYRLIDDSFGRVGLQKISYKFHKKKEAFILNYLGNELRDVLEKFKDVDDKGVYQKNSCIWVCWWTGLDSAPALVQKCVESIQKNAGKHPVHIITQANYMNFLNIPCFLLNRLEANEIGLAHFSDYLRVCLLYQYGGLWLDATILCTKQIPEKYFEVPFFTCKSNYYANTKYISHLQWVTFVLGGWKGNCFYAFLKKAFEQYWTTNDSSIDYLFFDNLIYLARQNIFTIKAEMDQLPINNPHRDDLQAAFNACLPANELCSIIKEDTCLYKLSWREIYNEKTTDGQESIYGYFLRM